MRYIERIVVCISLCISNEKVQGNFKNTNYSEAEYLNLFLTVLRKLIKVQFKYKQWDKLQRYYTISQQL